MRLIKLMPLAQCIVVGLFITSCTNKETPPKDTLVFAIESQPNTLDPRFATDANGQRLVHLLFNSIVKLGPDLTIVGDAAESWTYDKLIFKFTLKKNLTFSNARPLNKEDILFTFQQYQSDKSPFQTNFKAIQKVEVEEPSPGQFTIKISLSEFSALLLTDMTLLKLLPKQEVEAAGEDFAKNPIGTGSYKFLKKEDNLILFEARDNHAVVTPKIKNLQFKVIADDNTRYLKTIKGNIDIAQNTMPLSKIKELESNNDLAVMKYPGASMNYLLVNLKDPVLKNLFARQAINNAINREEIIQYKLDGLGTVATSIMGPGNPFFNESIKQPQFDLTKSVAVIKSNDLDGKELTLKTSNTQEVVEIGKVLVNQLEKTGLKVKLQSYEWGTFFNDIKSGNFQLATMRWVGATDPDIYRIAFHSKEFPPGRNRGFYSNLLLDKLLDKGTTIESEKNRIEHYMKVQQIVYEDLPMIPLWYNTQVAVVNKRVKGYSPPKNGDFSIALTVTKD